MGLDTAGRNIHRRSLSSIRGEKNTATVGKLVVGLLLIGVPAIEDIARLTRRKG